MNIIGKVGITKAILTSWLLLWLIGCAAPTAEMPTAAPTWTATPTPAVPTPMNIPLTPTLPPQPPMIIMGWDNELGSVIRAVDPATGQDAPGYAPIFLGADRDALYTASYTVAPDGRRLAGFDVQGDTCTDFAGGSACGPRSETLVLLDTTTWQHRVIPLGAFGWVNTPLFDAAGERLAFSVQTAEGQILMLLDVATGETVAQATLNLKPSYLGFGPDGSLVVYGQPETEQPGTTRPGAPRVQLRDGATLAVLWQTTLDGVTSGHWCSDQCDAGHGTMMTEMWSPGVALSADGRTLVILHADEDRLTTIDLVARTTAGRAIGNHQTGLGRLLGWLLDATAGVAHAKGPMNGTTRQVALSPDGARLYATGYRLETAMDADGNTSMTETRLPVQLIDVATGAILAESEFTGHTLGLSADGRRVFVAEWGDRWPMTRVLDAATLALLDELDGPTVRLAPDTTGQLRLVGEQYVTGGTMLSLLDAESMDTLAEWRVDELTQWAALR